MSIADDSSDGDSAKSVASLADLERFIVDNDELFALENRIGKFNIFDALRATRDELKHSNFLAWLLDPYESHGQGSLFTKAVLMYLLPSARDRGYSVPVSPILIDAAQMHGLSVERESDRIDILITCDDPSFVIAIENKIDSGEHGDQLERYKQSVARRFPSRPALFVFLTREGDAASDEDWCSLSYAELHAIFLRVRQSYEKSIGDDVLLFLDHYLSLIGSRFMDDAKIDELCKTIYKNHRAAIDLIVDRVAAERSPLIAEVESLIEANPNLHLIRVASKEVHFLPISWQKQLPQIGRRDPAIWLYLSFNIWDNKQCGLNVCLRETTNQMKRQSYVDVWLNDYETYGLKPRKKELARDWNSLGRHRIFRWTELDESQVHNAGLRFERMVEKWLRAWDSMPGAIQHLTSK